MSDPPAISVVVMGYRNRATILDAVASIVEQDFGEPFEVVVVTSGGDDSAMVVAEHFPDIAVVEAPGRLLPGGARNVGVAATSGSIVAFLAADCVAAPGWLAARVRAHRQGHVAVASAVRTASPQRPATWALHFDMYCHRLVGRPAGTLRADDPGAHGLSFARELLARVGSFDDTVRVGEDTDAARRVAATGVDIWYEPSIITVYHGPRSLLEMLAEARVRNARKARRSSSSRVLTRADVARAFGPAWAKGVLRRVKTAWRYGDREEHRQLVVSLPWLVACRAAALAGWYSVRIHGREADPVRFPR